MSPVWIVAGAPGAGKTTVAQAVAKACTPPAALLDKDTIYGGFVAGTLAAAGRPAGEREGAWYDTHIKAHEYSGLAATAAEIRQSGCPVVVCAPYSSQIRDLGKWQQLVADMGGPEVHLIWVRSDPEILRRRIIDRGSPRDSEKLQAFETFVGNVKPDIPPPVPHHLIDNRHLTHGELLAAARALVSNQTSRGH